MLSYLHGNAVPSVKFVSILFQVSYEKNLQPLAMALLGQISAISEIWILSRIVAVLGIKFYFHSVKLHTHLILYS